MSNTNTTPVYGTPVGLPLIVDQTYNLNSPNAQSGKAINEALSVFEEIPIEYVGDFTTIHKVSNGVYEIIEIYSEGEFTSLSFDVGNVHLYVPSFVLPPLTVGSKIYIELGEEIAEGLGEYPVNKLAVVKDKYLTANAQKLYFSNDGYPITTHNNTEFIANEPINYLNIYYPATDFICSISFTIADEGYFEIYFPDGTKHIGGKPDFQNGQTWELNIKNGVVVGGLVE